MKTRFLIIIGIMVILTISIGVVIWPEYGMVCNNAVVDHLQKYSNVFDESVTYDTYGIKEIGSPFGVHSVNLQECVDFILEKRTKSLENTKSEPVFTGISLLNNNPEFVKRILDYCDSTGIKLSIGLRSSNGTHIITNNTCEWQTIEKHESDSNLENILDRCLHGNVGFTDEDFARWHNATHFIDTEECLMIKATHSGVSIDRTVYPIPIPEPKRETTDEQEIRKDKARITTQEIIMTDYRGNQHQIDAINEYRNEFESGYFLEQYIHTFDQDYDKNDLINFVLVEWGYQETDCTYPKIELYFMPYETNIIEKIGEWEKPKDYCSSIDSDENGYVVVDVQSMPGIIEPHETCTIPGEYRISVTNLKDTPDVGWGYFTCQKDNLVGNSEPWMDLPR